MYFCRIKKTSKSIIMELIDYTNKWLAGEIFEGKSILIAGLCLLVLTIIVWRVGSTDYARAILLPMLVVAILHIGIGAGMFVYNKQRIPQFEEQYSQQTTQEYLESENTRVDEFMKIYPKVIIFAAISFIVAICLFAFCTTPWLRATALALIYLALSCLVIDYFSKERGMIYQQELNEQREQSQISLSSAESRVKKSEAQLNSVQIEQAQE